MMIKNEIKTFFVLLMLRKLYFVDRQCKNIFTPSDVLVYVPLILSLPNVHVTIPRNYKSELSNEI